MNLSQHYEHSGLLMNARKNPAEALECFVKLTLLFHSASPWDSAKKDEWHRLQTPILRLATPEGFVHAQQPGLGEGYVEATTKGLCDLGRAILREMDKA